MAAPPGSRSYLVEGEKDADNLLRLGLVATTNPGGAAKLGSYGKWRSEFSSYLAGFDIIILPDNDDAGREHAERIATAVARVALSVRILPLPDLPPKGDVSNWIAAGGTREQLEEAAAGVASFNADLPGHAAGEQQNAIASMLARQFSGRTASSEFTGNLARSSLEGRNSREIEQRIQRLGAQFPVLWNREFISTEQGIKSSHQGIYQPDQGTLGCRCWTAA